MTEDPNIATLRELLENHGNREERAALDALVTTLAEKDRKLALVCAPPDPRELMNEDTLRLAEKEARLRELEEAVKTLCVGAAESVARLPEGELAEAIQAVSSFAGDFADATEANYVDKICRAAEAWARLQWRKASEAPIGVNLLVWVRKRGVRTISEGHRLECGTWVVCGIHRDIYPDDVLGFIPIDALPTLNGGDDAESR